MFNMYKIFKLLNAFKYHPLNYCMWMNVALETIPLFNFVRNFNIYKNYFHRLYTNC